MYTDIYTLAEILEVKRSIPRKKKLVVGVITGTFDITHIDHARAIQRAHDYCDVLVVAVKSNEGAARKDHRRPIWDQSERVQMVDSLKCVDYVVKAEYCERGFIKCKAENESQRDWLIMFEPVFKAIRPDILFHEPNQQLLSAREAAAEMYDFHLFKLKRGTSTSTTKTIETILARYGKAED